MRHSAGPQSMQRGGRPPSGVTGEPQGLPIGSQAGRDRNLGVAIRTPNWRDRGAGGDLGFWGDVTHYRGK